MASMTASRPRSNAPQARSHPAPVRMAARIAHRMLRRPRRTLVIGVSLIAASVIMLNALVFQKVRHPSPYLATARSGEAKPTDARLAAGQSGSAQPVAPPARPSTFETAEGTKPAPASTNATLAKSNTAVPARNAAAREATTREVPLREVAPRDQIAELIMNGDLRPPADVGRGDIARNDVKKPVLPAQKALLKLGYGPVKPDGRLGDEMRAALERFERDRRLPVTRDLSPRTTRELASASGIRIE